MIPTTCAEFNDKYRNYLENGFYGLVIENRDVISYLDIEFQKEITKNNHFQYSQIKMKFGSCTIYSTSNAIHDWEKNINQMLKK